MNRFCLSKIARKAYRFQVRNEYLIQDLLAVVVVLFILWHVYCV